MRKKQINFFTMSVALDKFYQKYEDRIKSDALLNRLFEEFFELLNQMQEAVQIQKGFTSEASKQKQIEEEEMIEATVRYAARGYIYATEKKMPGLQEKFSVSSWKLQRLNNVQLHSACLSVYDALSKISPDDIAEYGITPETIAELKIEIDGFYALIPQPRADIITRSQATAEIESVMKKMQSLLTKRLDKAIYSLGSEDKTLKNEYQATRIIINISGRKSDTATSSEEEAA